jgi:hypoxanthine phosphoribosyltransferase
MDCRLSLLISRGVIDQTVSRLAAQITEDYRDRQLVAIGVLKGAFIFMADLVRQIGIPLEIDFVMVSSYGSRTESSRCVTMVNDLTIDVRGKDVLLVEDIVDSGHTVSFVMQHLRTRGVQSVRLCALADKPSRRETSVDIHYLGFTVPDRFVVGYGLDFDNRFRYLPDIYCVENHDPGE